MQAPISLRRADANGHSRCGRGVFTGGRSGCGRRCCRTGHCRARRLAGRVAARRAAARVPPCARQRPRSVGGIDHRQRRSRRLAGLVAEVGAGRRGQLVSLQRPAAQQRRAAGAAQRFARVDWRDEKGNVVSFDRPIVDFFAGGWKPPATPEYPLEESTSSDGWTSVSGVYRAPGAARQAVLELHLQWAKNARVEWRDVALVPCEAPKGRHARLAAVHFTPTAKTPRGNCEQFAPLVAEAARQKADLVVLPEVITQVGTGLSAAAVAEPIPGPSTDYFSRLARAPVVDRRRAVRARRPVGV